MNTALVTEQDAVGIRERPRVEITTDFNKKIVYVGDKPFTSYRHFSKVGDFCSEFDLGAPGNRGWAHNQIYGFGNKRVENLGVLAFSNEIIEYMNKEFA
jgi:hypothetical protein